MIFKNIELFNVDEVTEDKENGGYILHRVPLSVENALSDGGKRMNTWNTGVEFRFVMKSDEVTLRLRTVEGDALPVLVYFGSLCGSWDNEEVNRVVYREPTDIVIRRPAEMATYEKISDDYSLPYSATVVRVILQPGPCRLIDVIGECEPPTPDLLPRRKYLAYGSSITHGSLALSPVRYFAFRIGEAFRAESRNLGFAGAAYLEKEVADYLAAADFDFATLELGVNVFHLEDEEFDRRVRYMIRVVAASHPNAEIFCVSPFYCNADMQGSGKPHAFRRIISRAVAECGFANVHEINGLSCLSTPDGLSGDLTHPNPMGVDRITDALTRQMAPFIR